MRLISKQSFRHAQKGGANILMTIGATVFGIGASALAIDLPYYFAAQNQLQTAVDAAALAGAAALPDGNQQAKDAAYKLASQNPVGGSTLQASDLQYTTSGSSFQVSASAKVPTVISKFLCSMSASSGAGKDIDGEGMDSAGSGSNASANCNYMTVYAGSKALPAARDTILVLDVSSSMSSLGNGRPFKDVRDAAKNYIGLIANLKSESVDRLGVVSFSQNAKLEQALVAQSASPGFNSVKTKIDALKLFSGAGWNTNYQAGLKIAMDEMEAHGRKNADKIIIFLTDGMPNLPAPSNYYTYSQYEPYTKCTDMVDNSTAVKALCKKQNGKTVCPVLPSAQITNSMISSAATTCMTTYKNYMQDQTNAQSDRAKAQDVTINTISIYDENLSDDNAQQIFRRLLKDSNWRPNQLEYMADTTKGQQYESPNYDATRISNIYKSIAQDIHIKLSN